MHSPARGIQVVEPTLEGYAGHCHGLVSSFCGAAAGARIDLWAAHGSAPLDFGPGVTVHPWFRRRIRLPQAFFLLRRLLRRAEPVLVMTARRSDLVLVDWIARRRIPDNRVFLYFHWLKETPGKLRFLSRLAPHLPKVVILGTTASVVETFRRCGFANVLLVPYPATRPAPGAAPVPFRQLLYAGAARRDKGFAQVVDLVELLARKRQTLPVTIQVSADHYAKYDSATRTDIARLQALDYAPLRLVRETLSPGDYAALFPGSICLQPYRRDDFTDRVSGITLDALAHGCPIVATSGTWMASLVTRFGAGVALEDLSAASLHRAVDAMIARYASYEAAATAAGLAQDRDSWTPLLDRLRR
jgi:glycosyltransferase involved in cell wall biosynthesis